MQEALSNTILDTEPAAQCTHGILDGMGSVMHHSKRMCDD